MYNVQAKVISVILGATGTTLKKLENTRVTHRESTKSGTYKNSHTGHCTHYSESTKHTSPAK